MKFFVDDLTKRAPLEPVEKAAWIQAEFVKTHPFQDRNGRTARLMMNYSLMMDGYPPTIIKKSNVNRYFQALATYSMAGDITDFVSLLKGNLERELDVFIAMYECHLEK